MDDGDDAQRLVSHLTAVIDRTPAVGAVPPAAFTGNLTTAPPFAVFHQTQRIDPTMQRGPFGGASIDPQQSAAGGWRAPLYTAQSSYSPQQGITSQQREVSFPGFHGGWAGSGVHQHNFTAHHTTTQHQPPVWQQSQGNYQVPAQHQHSNVLHHAFHQQQQIPHVSARGRPFVPPSGQQHYSSFNQHGGYAAPSHEKQQQWDD
jgi:hypothetical protein